MVVKGIDREGYFRKNKTRKCWQCNKIITPETAILGYNRLFCEGCYKKFRKQAEEEVDRAFADDFEENPRKNKKSELNELRNIKKRLKELEKEKKNFENKVRRIVIKVLSESENKRETNREDEKK